METVRNGLEVAPYKLPMVSCSKRIRGRSANTYKGQLQLSFVPKRVGKRVYQNDSSCCP